MKRVQVMLDDNLAMSLKNKAIAAGLSVSAYARLILNDRLKKKVSVIDQALLDLDDSDDDAVVTLESFKSELSQWIKNADH